MSKARAVLGWGALCLALWLAGCGDSDEGGGGSPGAPGPGPGPGAKTADALFREEEVNEFHLTIDPADWESIVWDTRGDEYRTCTLQWKSVIVSNVGVRPSGHATRLPGNEKMSLKFDFNVFVQGQKFLGLKSLKLDGLYEATMMRERISYGIFRTHIPTTPRVAHCLLYMNGEYRGVYEVEERLTDDLIDHRYGNEDGTLYRLTVTHPEAFTDRGPDPESYMPWPFQPQMNEETGDHSVLPRLVQTLNQNPGAFGTICDLDNLTTFLALEVCIMSRDGFLRDDGPPQNNHAYYKPSAGRFEFIPWDLDQTWTTERANLSIYTNFEKTRIASIVRDTPELDAIFRQKINQFRNTLTHPDIVGPRIDAIYEQIRASVHADPYKHTTNSNFDQMPEYLKNVARLRYQSLGTQLGVP